MSVRRESGATEVARFFDLEAKRYDAAYDAMSSGGHTLRARMAAVLELLGPKGGSVLDIGMGPGRLLVELDDLGWEVSGADPSREMVKLTQSRLPHATNRLVQAPAERLPFPNERFDAIVATGVLEYVDDLRSSLGEFARVLRPGGRAVVSIPNSRAPYGVWRRRVWYAGVNAAKRLLRFGRPVRPRADRVIPLAQLEALLSEAGFQVQAIRHAARLVVPSPLDSIAPRFAARVAGRFERGSPCVGRILGTQTLVAAGKHPHSPVRAGDEL